MSEDLWIVLIWFAIVLGLASATHQLLRWTGVLVASQGAMLLIGAFSYTIVLRHSASVVYGMLASVVLCGALGLAHRYLLYVVGPLLFVLLCITSDVFLSEAWLALPNITGGSGGLPLPGGCDMFVAEVSSLVCVLITVVSRIFIGKQNTFWWATIRAHGWHSGLFGVDDRRSLTMIFVTYGVIAGLAGSSVAASMGFVSPSGLNLPFTIAIMMIAAASPVPGIVTLISLSGLYAAIRTVLRQSVEASPIMAFIFEVSFPIILTLFVCISIFVKNRSTSGTKLTDYF